MVDRLGAGGDGVATIEGRTVFVSGALPGERVLVEIDGERARLLKVETASPDRVEPFCPYFGRCGGCSAQHIGPALYAEWKRENVAKALIRSGVKADVLPLVPGHGEGRRRVTFHAREIEGAMRVGFMAARSHNLVEIDHCPITVPELQGAAEAAATLAQKMKGVGKPLDVAITSTVVGSDVEIRGSGPVDERRRQALIEEAGALGLARLSLHGETLVEFRKPTVRMGRASVALPAGSFLQATAAGEAALANLVVDAARGAKRVADLFAGSGPLSLRLAETAEVHAVENDRAALSALDRAARETPGCRRVTTETRDLFRRPLLAPELSRFDAVVLDPPRAGAEAQCKQLVLSSVPTVIMVSCDPGTFARDAAILAEGGFHPASVVPVDQFAWSAHVEIVGVFERRKSAPRRRR